MRRCALPDSIWQFFRQWQFSFLEEFEDKTIICVRQTKVRKVEESTDSKAMCTMNFVELCLNEALL